MTLRNTNQIKIGTAAATAVIGGEQSGIADENERPGWLFRKVAAGTDKINWYFYGTGNKQLPLSSLRNISATISIDNYQSTKSIPFINVYTIPTGIGDAGPWYHSKITYSIQPGQTIILGEAINIFTHNPPTQNNSLRSIPFNTRSVLGDGAPDEPILTIAFNTDSASPALTQILVEELGFSLHSSNTIDNRIKLIS